MFQRRIDWTDPDGIIAQLVSKNYADLKVFFFMNRSENIKMLLKRILHDIVPNIKNAEPVGKSDNRTLKMI